MKKIISNYFSNIEDPRSFRNQRHDFNTLLGASFLAVLSGIDSFCGIEDFVTMHFKELKRYFKFPGGVPSHDTYQRFWSSINPDEFLKSFQTFVNSLQKVSSDIINIDGKTIRNSGEDNPLHIVSAWCKANHLVLGQEKVAKKSNEITAIPKLLKLLDLENCTVTIDAMGAQRNICEQIIEQKGDYVISLKGNQSNLHNDVKLYFEDANSLETCVSHEENDKGHGRIEQRIAYVTDCIDWLQENHKWPGLKSIGMVQSKVIKKEKETTQTRFYISSLSGNAKRLNEVARAHWSVESELHWVLDSSFNEDRACIRKDNAAENMNIMRKWALNILYKAKDKPSRSIKSLMRKNIMSVEHLVASVKKIFHA